jgi:hypothetical protein
LWVSAPITIMHTVPSSIRQLMKRTVGGHTSVGAMPRSYQVTPAILGRRRATRPLLASPQGRHNS